MRKGLRRSALLSGMAVAATGVAVSSGVALPGVGTGGAAVLSAGVTRDVPTVASTAVHQGELLGRTQELSRSAERALPLVKPGLDQRSGGQTLHTENLAGGDPRTIARALLPQFGFSSSQFSCLDALWSRESGWRVNAANPSGAYGIPQALPGSKMSSAGPNWSTSATTQIKWGLGYIGARYGSPCGAWGHSQSYGWY
ncbi:MAG: lytic transglycosylase domain-containing protein [Nocardioidaceae bacterium]